MRNDWKQRDQWLSVRDEMADGSVQQRRARGTWVTRGITAALTLSVLVLALILGWLVVGAQLARDQRMAANERERHTLTVLLATSSITQSTTDAQSAERGFLLTRNPVYLDRYANAWRQAGDAVFELDELTSDSARQSRNVERLRRLMVLRRGEMDRIIALAQRDLLDENQLAIRFGQGKRTMDALRGIALVIENEENRLLAIRRDNLRRAERNAQLASNWLAAASIGLVLLVGLLAFAALRERRVAVQRRIADEAELRSAETRRLLQTVIDNSADPIYVKDREGRLVYANARVAEIYGTTLDQLIGRTDADFLPPTIADELRANDAEVLASGRPVNREEIVPEGAEQRVFFSAKSPWREGNAIVGIIGISRDITPLKEEERRLKGSNTELEARVAERTQALTDAIGRIEREMTEREAAEEQVRQFQKMESIGQLSGGIAHDFNNMLAIVIGSLEIVRRRLPDQPSPQLIENLDNAQEGARRAAELTARLLAYARQQPLAPRAVDLNELVTDVSGVLARTLGDTIEVDVRLAPAVGAVSVDVPQMESAIINIAVNARDAMPDGGRLTIATGTRGDRALLRITDTGTGMPPEVVGRAFDPFYTTKGVGKGTGMGLSQVQGFIAQSGGDVSIESSEGKGTTVELTLPLTDRPAEVTTLPLAGNARRTERATILVVEDEALVRKVAVATLEEEGHLVHEAGDGEAALKILEAQRDIALMMTDIAMPRMDGHELAARARALRPDLRILFTTGYDATQNGGGGDVLQKPYLPGDLLNAIDEALSQKLAA